MKGVDARNFMKALCAAFCAFAFLAAALAAAIAHCSGEPPAALQAAAAEAARAAPVAGGIDLAALNFRYRIAGDKVDWRPVRAFDDTRQLFIEFGEGVATGDMPPLFVIAGSGEAELVNYRVQGRYMIVDRLFERGELRLGAGKQARTVRIERETPATARKPAAANRTI